MAMEEAIEYALREDESASLVPSTPERTLSGKQPIALTRREEEIVALVAQGLTNRQIATELSISEHTAATHVAKILKKLDLHSRSQLAAWVHHGEM
jgi:DNA-binding NarL/FixJ family response regulator